MSHPPVINNEIVREPGRRQTAADVGIKKEKWVRCLADATRRAGRRSLSARTNQEAAVKERMVTAQFKCKNIGEMTAVSSPEESRGSPRRVGRRFHLKGREVRCQIRADK